MRPPRIAPLAGYTPQGVFRPRMVSETCGLCQRRPSMGIDGLCKTCRANCGLEPMQRKKP